MTKGESPSATGHAAKSLQPGDGYSPGRSRRRKNEFVGQLVLGLLLAVLTWPFSPSSLVVAAGTTGSWQSALAMAAHDGLESGTRIVFTYGPLGFLTAQQLNFAGTGIASFLFALGFATVLFAILLWSLSRVLPLWGALPLAYIIGAVSLHADAGAAEDIYALVLIVCVALLSRSDDEPAPNVIWVGLGVVLGTFSLVKVSLGVGVTAVLIVTVLSLRRARWQAVKSLFLGVVPVFCLAWFGTGNGIGNLLPFARSSVAVISGYGPAMSYDYPNYDNPLGLTPNRTFTYWWAAIAVVMVLAFALVHCRGLDRRARVGILLIALIVLWLLFKEGFVRHDSQHDVIFFGAALVSLAAFDLGSRWKVPFVAGLLLLSLVTVIVAGGAPQLVFQPLTSTQNFVHEAMTLSSSGKRAKTIRQSREFLQAWYSVPKPMLALMQSHTADIAPQEQSAAWAYPRIRFDPLPVIQDYSAYTSSLDDLDRDYLATTGSPDFILRQNGGTADGRNPAFEPPATQLAIECRYRQVLATSVWQLLERRRDRCGPMRLLDVVSTGFNGWVVVPTATGSDDTVVAAFRLALGSTWTLQTVLFKPPNLFMGYNNGRQYWRFIAATAPDLHVVHAASSLGYSPPYVPTSVDRLRLFIHGRAGGTSGIKVSFYEIPIG